MSIAKYLISAISSRYRSLISDILLTIMAVEYSDTRPATNRTETMPIIDGCFLIHIACGCILLDYFPMIIVMQIILYILKVQIHSKFACISKLSFYQ